MKYVLCVPRGGLNDMLVQISKCYDYCIKYNRTLLVNTVSTSEFRDSLSYYFESKSDLIKIDYYEILNILKGAKSCNSTCYPNINYIDYQVYWSNDLKKYMSRENNCIISFNFNTLYDEELLIHYSCGGGRPNMQLFTNLKLKEDVRVQFFERYRKVIDFTGKNDFSAVHIRNTDMKTDNIDDFINSIPYKNEAFFISTDDKYSLDIVKNKYMTINFSDIEKVKISLHSDFVDMDIKRKRNIDSLIDLFLLSFSHNLIGSTESSGYFILAKLFKKNWEIRDSLFN